MGGGRLSAEDRALIESLTMQGLSARAIAERVPCTQRTVERWQRQSGVRSRFTPERAPCGTRARYDYGGCRCPECTKANTDYYRARRRAQRADTQPSDPSTEENNR